MRRWLAAALLALTVSLGLTAPAGAAGPVATRSALAKQMRLAGSASAALVVNLDTGEQIYARRPDTALVPASLQKLYTTSTALLRLGPDATLRTSVLATAPIDVAGVLDGDLYLRGGGDPTLTVADLDAIAFDLVSTTGLSEVTGRVVGDESAFDAVRGIPSSRWQTSAYVGPLSALSVNRSRTGRARPYWQARPADWAADAFARSLREAGVKVSKQGIEGITPPGALALSAFESPPVARLIRLANVPSDNYVAEMLLKALEAQDGTPGTTPRGAATVRSEMAGLGVSARVADGSGLSRSNRTSPRDVVRLLEAMDGTMTFWDSLAVAGRTGTLHDRMRRSAARDRCRGKTGTLISVSNVAGYCVTADGETVAFAILMNRVNPWGARRVQDRMLGVIARYGA